MSKHNPMYNRVGSANYNARTDEQTVAVIRHLSQYKEWTLRRLADQFTLSITSVHKIVKGKSWTEVDQQAEVARVNLYYNLMSASGEASTVARSSEGSVLHPYYKVVKREESATLPVQGLQIVQPLEMSLQNVCSQLEIAEGNLTPMHIANLELPVAERRVLLTMLADARRAA